MSDRESRTYVMWWQRVLLTSVFGFMTAALCLPVAQDSVLLAVAFGVPLVWVTVRASRCALVRLSPEGVLVRGLFRTHRAAWQEVHTIDAGPGSSMGLPWRVPRFFLRTGSFRAEEFRSLRTPSLVDEVVRVARQMQRASTQAS